MAGTITTTVRPTGSGSSSQWAVSSGAAAHYTYLDDVVTQPTISGDSDYVWADQAYDNKIDEIKLGSTTSIPSHIWIIDRIIVWFLAQDVNGDSITLRVNIKVNGSWQSEKSFIPTDGTFGWTSQTWTGNWTRDMLNDGDFQVRYQSEASMTGSEEFWIAVIYADIDGYPVQSIII